MKTAHFLRMYCLLPSKRQTWKCLRLLETAGKLAGKRKPYLKVSLEKKTIIGKYEAENGIVSALVHFAQEFPDNTWHNNI